MQEKWTFWRRGGIILVLRIINIDRYINIERESRERGGKRYGITNDNCWAAGNAGEMDFLETGWNNPRTVDYQYRQVCIDDYVWNNK